MKRNLVLLSLLCLGQGLFAQYVYTINADSVKITNHCDTAELIIENHTQTVPGFLFNKGRGRTEFRRVMTQVNDSTFLLGGDTLHINRFSYWRANGNHIYNINTGNVGVHRVNPKVLLDLPGPVNIDDTSAYRIGYHPVLRVGGYIDTVILPNPPDQTTSGGTLYYFLYTNLYAGDSSGMHNTGNFTTLVGTGAGQDNVGDKSTFVGYNSGKNNAAIYGAFKNSFFGSESGENSSGAWNTFIGESAGFNNQGENNTASGAGAAGDNAGGGNSFFGAGSGGNNTGENNSGIGVGSGGGNQGNYNCFMGASSGMANNGNENILIGESAGSFNSGSRNVFVGIMTGLVNDGNTNTFIGSGAGQFTTGAGSVTLIGSAASAGSVSNATAIGSNAVVNASNTMVFGDTSVTTWLFNSNAVPNAANALVVGSNATNGNGAYLTTGGVWTNASDINKKEDFETLNNMDVLEKIEVLPVTRWKYKGLPEWHIGPVAQDFHRLFQVGTDDKTISTIDPSGIALAGIKGLYRQWKAAEVKVKEQQVQVDKLQLQVQQQQAEMAQLLEKFNQLERVVNEQRK